MENKMRTAILNYRQAVLVASDARRRHQDNLIPYQEMCDLCDQERITLDVLIVKIENAIAGRPTW